MNKNSQAKDLPIGWKEAKLGEVFTIERGGSPRPIEDFITSSEEGINWIKIGDTKDVVKYIYRTKEKIKPEGAKRSRMVFEDDFLLSNSMSFGRPYIMKTTGCIHDGWLVIRKNETIDNNYLYYILSSNLLYQQFSNLAKGSTVKNLNIEAVKQAIITFPSLPEQHAIVSKIEELLSELDKGKQQLETAQQQLQLYRQAVLKWAFEGKLTNTDVNEGELPKEWKVLNIGEIFEVYIGSTPKRNIPSYWGGDINWVSSGEIAFKPITSTKEKITYEGLANTSCKVHPIGTVIIAMIGEGKTRGQTAILKIEATHNQNTAAIRVDDKFYKSELLYYYLILKYEDNRKVGSGNNQKALNKERVKSIAIPVPPITEQSQIVHEIESRLSVCDKVEETITSSLQQAETLRQSILKKAFEGKLV
jgi:type I restriction enzyme S subunit